MVVTHDPSGRRGLWFRTNPPYEDSFLEDVDYKTVEFCAGREGEGVNVSISSHEIGERKMHDLVDCIQRNLVEADQEESLHDFIRLWHQSSICTKLTVFGKEEARCVDERSCDDTPDDYELCGTCGFDHEYDLTTVQAQKESREAHEANGDVAMLERDRR